MKELKYQQRKCAEKCLSYDRSSSLLRISERQLTRESMGVFLVSKLQLTQEMLPKFSSGYRSECPHKYCGWKLGVIEAYKICIILFNPEFLRDLGYALLKNDSFKVILNIVFFIFLLFSCYYNISYIYNWIFNLEKLGMIVHAFKPNTKKEERSQYV